jgi:hypothetical protein
VSTYKQYAADLSPPFLQGSNGVKWHNGFNQHLDDLLEDTKAAVKARFPSEAADASDTLALGAIGSDSRVPRYTSETDAGYAERLVGRFGYHAQAGTEQGLLDDLAGLGFGDVTIMEYRDWPADAGDPNVHHSPGSWYDSTGVTPWWSRFWVLIGQYDGAAIPSGGVLGTGVLGVMPLGFELDADVIEMALDAVRRRKPAHALFASLTVLTDDTPVESVLGVGVLGTMVLGAAGSGPGSVVIDVNK